MTTPELPDGFAEALKAAQPIVEAAAPPAKFNKDDRVTGWLGRTWDVVDRHFCPHHNTWKYSLYDVGFGISPNIPEQILRAASPTEG